MATIPDYPYTVDDTETIRNRMLDQVSSDWDKTEGGFIYDAVSPAAIEVHNGEAKAQTLLENAFVTWNSGSYLDAKAAERGMYRRPAAAAKGSVRVNGTAGTSIYGGTKFSTQVDAGSTEDAVVFTTDALATIPGAGVIDIPVTCTVTGLVGNVQAGTVIVNEDRVGGLSSVTNPAAFTGGADAESDDDFRARYLDSAKNPSSSGNKADYKAWALAASPSVERAKVRPIWDGNGTVQVLLADTSLAPAAPDLVSTVQMYIDPAYSFTKAQADMTSGGNGVTVDGSEWKMVYNATLAGTLTVDLLSSLQANPAHSLDGIYRVGVKVRVGSPTATANLLQIQVTNITTNATAAQDRNGNGQAVSVVKASALSTSSSYVYVDFFWNGTDDIRLDLTRQQADTTTTLWVAQADVNSLFGVMQGNGLAPIGAKVSVMAPKSLIIDVQMQLVVNSAYQVADVQSKVTTAVNDYLKGLALGDINVVSMGRLSNAIFGVAGVDDCLNLQMRSNGGAWQTTNITIPDDSMPVPGAVTYN